MENINSIYEKATGINIDKQKRIWDERGKGYYGEYLVFCKLYQELPGFCKILMNLQLPTYQQKTTEIDLLLLHETGIYVFEIKHFKGTIYGNSNHKTWTQYFRTAPNQKFNNPVLQNAHHIRAVQAMFPNAPVHSCIVFTSSDCTLKVTNDHPEVTICHIDNLYDTLTFYMTNKVVVYTQSEIENIATAFWPFSAIKSTVSDDSAEITEFYNYIEEIKHSFDDARANLAHEYDEKARDIRDREALLSQTKKKATICCLLVVLLICLFSYLFCDNRIQKAEYETTRAQLELSEMKQNFMHVNELNDGNIEFVSGMIALANLSLTTSPDIVNATDFSCTLIANSENYGIRLTNETKYIVISKDGKVYEYDMFDSTNRYSSLYKIGKSSYPTFDITKQFYNLQPQDISYIKLTNLSLWKRNVNSNKDLLAGLELEIYTQP